MERAEELPDPGPHGGEEGETLGDPLAGEELLPTAEPPRTPRFHPPLSDRGGGQRGGAMWFPLKS